MAASIAKEPLSVAEEVESEEEQEKENEYESWWHVNKNGFPIGEETWEKMWKYVEHVHPSGEEVSKNIRRQNLRKVPIPMAPVVTNNVKNAAGTLAMIQKYISDLQYNHTGTQFFEIKKDRPLSRLMEKAKEMIQESLPIKCLEAAVLALYLTNPMQSVQRFMIGFKTKCGGKTYRHVVLGVSHSGCYGALGLSRRQDLMYKPLVHKTLQSLVEDGFMAPYCNNGHTVGQVKLSSAVAHDIHSCETIKWRACVVRPCHLDLPALHRCIDKHSKLLRTFHE